MINLSASPWHHGKGALRQKLITASAARLGCPVVYVNAVGGNDELIFDGRSLVADGRGGLSAKLAAFREDLRVVVVPAAGESSRAGPRSGGPGGRRPGRTSMRP